MDKRKTGLREIVLLAAPHTWAASCVPALLAAVLARVHTGRVSLVMALLTLPALAKGKLGRWQGVSLLCIYAAFCCFQFFVLPGLA